MKNVFKKLNHAGRYALLLGSLFLATPHAVQAMSPSQVVAFIKNKLSFNKKTKLVQDETASVKEIWIENDFLEAVEDLGLPETMEPLIEQMDIFMNQQHIPLGFCTKIVIKNDKCRLSCSLSVKTLALMLQEIAKVPDLKKLPEAFKKRVVQPNKFLNFLFPHIKNSDSLFCTLADHINSRIVFSYDFSPEELGEDVSIALTILEKMKQWQKTPPSKDSTSWNRLLFNLIVRREVKIVFVDN